MSVDEILKERGNRYGMFDKHAEITQGIKHEMAASRNWDSLRPDMKEALEMIAHKIGRILNGDPNYQDSWTDIIGYARLVEDTLNQEGQIDGADTGRTVWATDGDGNPISPDELRRRGDAFAAGKS